MITGGVDELVVSVSGAIHRLIGLVMALSITKEPLDLIYIPTPHLMNLTLHPTSHSLTTEIRDLFNVSNRVAHYG